MGKYDKEREALGVKSGASVPSGQSKYATMRAQLTPISQRDTQLLEQEQSDMEQMNAASRVANERTLQSTPLPEPTVRQLEVEQSDMAQMNQASKYAAERAELPGRDNPVFGPVLRALDVLEANPIRKKAGEIVQELYTPGAGLSAISATTSAVEGAVGRLLPKLANPSGLGGKVVKRAITEGTVGVPLVMGQSLASGETDLGEAAKTGLLYGGAMGAGLGGAIPVVGRGIQKFAGTAVGESLANLFKRKQSVTPDLEDAVSNALKSEVPSPQKTVTINGKLRPASQESYINSVMTQIKPEVTARMTPPLENPNELAKWLQPHLGDSSLNEIRRMSYDDLVELATEVRGQLSTYDIARQVAKERGFNLDNILNGKLPSITERVKLDASKRAYGVYDAPKLSIARPVSDPNFVPANRAVNVNTPNPAQVHQPPNTPIMATGLNANIAAKQNIIQSGDYSPQKDLARWVQTFVAGYGTYGGRAFTNAGDKVYSKLFYDLSNTLRNMDPLNPTNDQLKLVARQYDDLKNYVYSKGGKADFESNGSFAGIENRIGRSNPNTGDNKTTSAPQRIVSNKKTVDELTFARTVKDSPNSAQGLVDELNQRPLNGARTSDVLNRQEAGKLIEKHGVEGLYNKLMAKHLKFSASESTAAQMLAKHFSSLGGKDNMDKAISLVSRTAREGREMGQAIQALSQWNKLDETGALLLGERQLNQGVRDTSQWQSLTAEQAAPIQTAAQRIGQAQETKSLADEVLSIVTNKKPGEALTDAEKAVIKRFQQQVKEINEKAKSFLPKAKTNAQETVDKVQKIKPQERTRDQVVDFLEAKAELARKRLEKRRNIGLVAKIDNPVIDYAIIGAAELAKGIRTFADYSEVMVKSFGESVKPHLREAYLKSVNMFRKENGLPTVEELERVVNSAIKRQGLDETTAKSLKVWATEIGFIADKNLKVEATRDLQLALKELGKSSLGEKVASVETASMLLNVPTFLRNTIGNAGQLTLEKINKLHAVPIDWAVSKFTGERTIKFVTKNQESLLRNFMLGTKSGWEGVSPTGTLSSYNVNPNVFKNSNPLKYLTKLTGASLQGMDFAFYRAAYGDVVATYAEQMGLAAGMSKAEIKKQMPKLIEQLDQSIHDLADQAGLYATYQDETLLSKGAQGLRNALNKPTDKLAQHLVEKGLLKQELSWEGYGFGDLMIKFARTPANLVMRGIDYSPIGFVRAAFELAPLVFNRSKFNQFKAVRALSRAITGTLGLTGMGYVLADAGILTGAASMDKDERSIEEQSGKGAYKVNWSALTRWMTNGFDKSAAQYQKGDRIFDYWWVQPAAISLAMGVNFSENAESKDPDESTIKRASNAILGGLRSVLENPMVTGITNVVDATTDAVRRQSFDGYGDILKNVPARFVPTAVGQLRTARDNNQRETFDQNIFKEMMNIVKNKIPGLSSTLPVSYNSLGQPRERIQGGEANTLGQYLTSLLSPVKSTRYDVTPEAKLVLDVLTDSLDAGVLPRIGDKYIMVDDLVTKKQKRVNLTKEQFSKLQQVMGTNTMQKLKAKEAYLSNPNISAEKKAAEIKKILSEVGQRARNEVRTEMGYKKKQIR